MHHRLARRFETHRIDYNVLSIFISRAVFLIKHVSFHSVSKALWRLFARLIGPTRHRNISIYNWRYMFLGVSSTLALIYPSLVDDRCIPSEASNSTGHTLQHLVRVCIHIY